MIVEDGRIIWDPEVDGFVVPHSINGRRVAHIYFERNEAGKILWIIQLQGKK